VAQAVLFRSPCDGGIEIRQEEEKEKEEEGRREHQHQAEEKGTRNLCFSV
jgi:hypothetical protein